MLPQLIYTVNLLLLFQEMAKPTNPTSLQQERSGSAEANSRK